MSPTEREIKELDLDELLLQNKDCNVPSSAAVVRFSDDDFVDYVQRLVNPLSSSNDNSLKKMQKQLTKLESSQKKMHSEVENLKVKYSTTKASWSNFE